MNQNNLFAYMASVVSQLKEERRMGTAHVYQSTLRRVMEFEGEETLDFKDLTPAWLKSFQDHLLDSRLQWNTVSTYMRMLRAIYFRAVDDGVAPYRSRLFKGVYTGTKVTVKRAVGEETFAGSALPSMMNPGVGALPFPVAVHASRHPVCGHRLYAPLRHAWQCHCLSPPQDGGMAHGARRARSYGAYPASEEPR